MTYICNVPCGRCGEEVDLSEMEWLALCEEHNLRASQALVIGNLCSDCRAGFLDWLSQPQDIRDRTWQ